MRRTDVRPKVLFVTNSYGIGGISQSLSSLLSFIGKDIKADVFAFNSDGYVYKNFLNCRILKPTLFLSMSSASMNPFQLILHKFITFIRFQTKKVLGKDLTCLYIRMGSHFIKSKKYDVVVCYSESIAKFVCHIPAKRRIAWIHCDYKRYLSLNNNGEDDIYAEFDDVVCVSKYGKRIFDSIYPQYQKKSNAIHNLIDTYRINALSLSATPAEYNGIDCYKIVSIGRLDQVKQFSFIPSIASEIKQLCHKNFVWYIIGDGYVDEKEKILKEIIQHGLIDVVKLIGPRQNVYPYILNSNLLVNTSASEAYSLVNNEAKALGVPVVTNNFECASETIIDYIDGRVVPINEMATVITEIINCNLSFPLSPISNDEAVSAIRNLLNL